MAGEVVKNEKVKPSFWKRLKAEFKKIIWTDRPTLVKQTIAVIVISAIMCVIISLADGIALRIIQAIVG